MRRGWLVLVALLLGGLPAVRSGDKREDGFTPLFNGRDLTGWKVYNGKMEVWGADKDNAILFQHGFAMNHHQADHLIGPGRPLDTDKYFIICTDALGSTQTTFEHSTSPTNSGLKMKFPFYNGRDIVKAQYRLITETLGIPHLLAVTGISSGADHSVQFAVSYPDLMDGIFPVVGGAAWGTQGNFFGSLLLSIIESCKGWDGGNYDKVGWKLIGFKDDFYFKPPFGYYDREYNEAKG